MKKFTFACAILCLSMGMAACSDDDDSTKGAIGDKCSVAADCESGVCTEGKCAKKEDTGNKGAIGDNCSVAADCESGVCTEGICAKPAEEKNPCEGKTKGDSCNEDGTMICDENLNCVDVTAECNEDADCTTGDFNKCDAEIHKCYKINPDFEKICETVDGVTKAYGEEWIYADKSLENKPISTVCEGETPECLNGVCKAETVAEACGAFNPCKEPLLCSKEGKCIDDPHPDWECHEIKDCPEGKACLNHTCRDIPAEGSSCTIEGTTPLCVNIRTTLFCDTNTPGADGKGKIVHRKCDPGVQCLSTETAADCAEPCPSNLKAGDLETVLCDGKNAWNYICTEVDGQLLSLPQMETCANDCILGEINNDDPSKSVKSTCGSLPVM